MDIMDFMDIILFNCKNILYGRVSNTINSIGVNVYNVYS